jgi:putative transposase
VPEIILAPSGWTSELATQGKGLPVVARKALPLGMGMNGDASTTTEIEFDSQDLYNQVMKYKSNHNVVYSCKYHVVFCPKYRRPVLVDGIDERLKQTLREVAVDTRSEIIELEVMPDHVHVLVEVDPQFGIHRFVKLAKGCSSRFLRQEYTTLRSRLPTLWTNSYFVSTVGGAPLAIIKQYIENQKNA